MSQKVRVYGIANTYRTGWHYVAWCDKCKINPAWKLGATGTHTQALAASLAHANSYAHGVRRPRRYIIPNTFFRD